jgi:hypothetical protein
MGTQDPAELGYPGPTRYVLRRRERGAFWTAIFLYVFGASMVTLTSVSYAAGNSGWEEIVYFGFFLLLAVPVGISMLRDRAKVAGQVLLMIGDAGIYLADPPRRISWPEVAGLVAFRCREDDDEDQGKWLSRLVVVRHGQECLPVAAALGLPGPDRWGEVVELHDEKLRLRKLAAAVHAYSPGLPVWDAGEVKSIEGTGRA